MFNRSNLDKLNEFAIIKEVEVGVKPKVLPEKIKKMILRKREANSLVRQCIMPVVEFNKAIKKQRRKEYLQYINQGIEYLRNNDLQNSWKWIKKHAGIARPSAVELPVTDPNTKELVDDKELKIEIWKKHFQNLCTKEDSVEEIKMKYLINPLLKKISDSPITKDEIVFELKCTRNNKAAGEDNIPSEFYKIMEQDVKLESKFLNNILTIFNKILDEGICPKV